MGGSRYYHARVMPTYLRGYAAVPDGSDLKIMLKTANRHQNSSEVARLCVGYSLANYLTLSFSNFGNG